MTLKFPTPEPDLGPVENVLRVVDRSDTGFAYRRTDTLTMLIHKSAKMFVFYEDGRMEVREIPFEEVPINYYEPLFSMGGLRSERDRAETWLRTQ